MPANIIVSHPSHTHVFVPRATHQEGHEDGRDPHSDEHGADGRHVPWDGRILTSPSQPEAADDKKRATDHPRVQAVLGRRIASPFDH